MSNVTRRKLLTGGLAAAAGASGLALAAKLARQYGLIPPDGGGLYGPGETLTYAAQLLMTRHSLAREFRREQISNPPFPNEVGPLGEAFRRLQAGGFADWRLAVDGMVARPAVFSLSELRSFPRHSQITHLACEEGWSYIAEWTGVRLASLLDLVEIRPEARYVVFEPFPNPRQTTGVVRVLAGSIDMADAVHPQTLLAYGMNGDALPADHGAPVRLRLGRHLGYKNTKYLSRIILAHKIDFKGRGTWYGGI